MQTITTIGLDIAKSVFQVHGVDAEGKVIIRRQLKRRYVLAFFRKQAPYATLNAALYLSPGAASRNRETSSGLRTMGSLWGWRTNGRWLAILDRPSVTRKKNRSPDTVLFMLAAEMPSEARCS